MKEAIGTIEHDSKIVPFLFRWNPLDHDSDLDAIESGDLYLNADAHAICDGFDFLLRHQVEVHKDFANNGELLSAIRKA